jgi:hypothetical protein
VLRAEFLLLSIRYAREKGPVSASWINVLLEKKPARLVSVAVANKTARIAWALLGQEAGLSGCRACRCISDRLIPSL